MEFLEVLRGAFVDLDFYYLLFFSIQVISLNPNAPLNVLWIVKNLFCFGVYDVKSKLEILLFKIKFFFVVNVVSDENWGVLCVFLGLERVNPYACVPNHKDYNEKWNGGAPVGGNLRLAFHVHFELVTVLV